MSDIKDDKKIREFLQKMEVTKAPSNFTSLVMEKVEVQNESLKVKPVSWNLFKICSIGFVLILVVSTFFIPNENPAFLSSFYDKLKLISFPEISLFEISSISKYILGTLGILILAYFGIMQNFVKNLYRED